MENGADLAHFGLISALKRANRLAHRLQIKTPESTPSEVPR